MRDYQKYATDRIELLSAAVKSQTAKEAPTSRGSVWVLTGQPGLHVRTEQHPLGKDLAGDGGGLGRHAGGPGGSGGPDGEDGPGATGPHRRLGVGVH